MKFFLIIVVLIVNVNYCLAQVKNIETENGVNIYYYPNGVISSKGMMQNSEPNGIWESYHVNGNLKSFGKWNNGVIDSIWIFYNENGSIHSKISYLNGKKNGYYIKYLNNFNGDDSINIGIKSKELYIDNVKSGLSEFYYDNGKKFLIENYKNSLRNGFSKVFDTTGLVVQLIEYRNGIEIERQIINQYKNGKKIGIWKEFHSNGRLSKEAYYLEGKLNGLVKEYDFFGELISSFRYENDIIIDSTFILETDIQVVEEFYNTVNEFGEKIKKTSGSFKNNKPIGVHQIYDSTGRVVSSKIYDDKGNLTAEGVVNVEGDKVGEWKFYYENGAIKCHAAQDANQDLITEALVWAFHCSGTQSRS